MADSPYQYINDTGLIVPDVADILTGVQGDYQTAFGADLIVTPDTPQGVLITGETLARSQVVRNNAAVANQINPNLAGGPFLDGICALTGITRLPATQSVVTATLSGVANTLIPAGSRAQTVAGDVFASASAALIGSGGSVDVQFVALEFGPIGCLAGELVDIVDDVLGWESITNSAGATVGKDEQTDESLRAYRKNTLANQGISLVQAQLSALYATTGVKSATFRENTANTTQTIDGVSMVAHSVYACVDGGTDLDVATTLFKNKSGGSPWNGGTSVDVKDPSSGQTYTVKFDRPTAVPIGIHVTVTNAGSLADPTSAVKNALLDFANGLQAGNPGFSVGSSVSVFELAGAIYKEQPQLFISAMTIATPAGGSYSTATISVGINQKATLSASDIVVTIV